MHTAVASKPTCGYGAALMAERYGLVHVPNTTLPFETGPSAHDIIAQQQRDGWQLVSSRVDQYDAEIMVFHRPV